MASGIYKIKNIVTDDIYVGQTNNFDRRFAEHKRDLNNQKAANIHLQRAWNKYKECSFEFSIVEECPVEKLNEREMFWVAHYDSYHNGYNMTFGGDGTRGYVATEETRRKISAGLRGKPKSPEHIQKMRNGRKLYFETHPGTTETPVVCLNTKEHFATQKDAAAQYGMCSTNIGSCCRKVTHSAGKSQDGVRLVWVYGQEFQSMTDKDIDTLIAAASAPREYPADMGERISRGLKGKPKSEEHIEKMRQAHKVFVEQNGVPNQIPVVCLNTEEFFESAADAARHYNIQEGGIRRCCIGELHSSGKDSCGAPLVWKNKDDFLKMTPEEKLSALSFRQTQYTRKVRCVTTGVIYDSIKEASIQTNTNVNSIIACCKGKRKSAGPGKMQWEYVDGITAIT